MKNSALKLFSLVVCVGLTALVIYELKGPAGFFSRWTPGTSLKSFKNELAVVLSQNSICARTFRNRWGGAIVLSRSKQRLSHSEIARLKDLIDREFGVYQVDLESAWLNHKPDKGLTPARVRYTYHYGMLSLQGKYGGKGLDFLIEIPFEFTTGPWETNSILDCSAAKPTVP